MIHIVCLATLFALALNLSLRLAGRGLVIEPLASLAARFIPGIWICLGVLLLTGSLLIIAEPHRTISNPAFYAKMVLLAIAMALTLGLAALARRQPDETTRVRVALAAVYMLTWIGIIIAGRFIAYLI
jgi:hypothetical protein